MIYGNFEYTDSEIPLTHRVNFSGGGRSAPLRILYLNTPLFRSIWQQGGEFKVLIALIWRRVDSLLGNLNGMERNQENSSSRDHNVHTNDELESFRFINSSQPFRV